MINFVFHLSQALKLSMDHPDTFLSCSLKDLLVTNRTLCNYSTPLNEINNRFVTSSLIFNWQSIAPLISNLSDLLSEDILKYNDRLMKKTPPGSLEKIEQSSISEDACLMYFEASSKMWPVWMEAGRVLKSCSNPPVHLWEWTKSVENLKSFYEQLRNSINPVAPVKTVLFLTSVLERSLGNVYLTRGRCVPFLLRDLLVTYELNEIFGCVPILTARILLGTPLAFNVRNICWHGFPAPHEVHSDIAAALFVLLTSLGDELQRKEIINISLRPQVTAATWEPAVKMLQNSTFPILYDRIPEVRGILDSCLFISDTHRPYWKEILELFECKRYGECLLILLPTLEQLLRCAFCYANNCPDRILLAEQHTFYTTMDEILAQYVVGSDGIEQSNSLRTMLGDKVFEAMMDLFDSFEGPRVRDKLSHGECELCDISGDMVNHILCVALLVIRKMGRNRKSKLEYELNSAEKIYFAKFHPASLLIFQTKTILDELERLRHSPKASDIQSDFVCAEVLKLESVVLKFSNSLLNSSHVDVISRINQCLQIPTSTLYRSRSDLEVIAILRKISNMLEETCKNSYTVLVDRHILYTEHKLRSRQRETYFHMLNFLPSLHAILQCVLLIVLLQLLALPRTMIKFLRQLLKYTENMASYSNHDKNRWIDMKKQTSIFCFYASNVLSI